MKFTPALILLFALCSCLSTSVMAQDSSKNIAMLINVYETDTLIKAPRTIVPLGVQKRLKLKPFVMDAGLGETLCYLLDFPQKRKHPLDFEFTSEMRNAKIYLPIYILLDSNYKQLSVIAPERRNNINGYRLERKIKMAQNVRYMIITTDPSLFNSTMTQRLVTHNTGVMMVGGIAVPVNYGDKVNYNLVGVADSASIYALLPVKYGRYPYRRESGAYLGFGANFGSETVAENTHGDDYKAGGGVFFHLGYTQPLFNTNFVGRAVVGYAYQGHKEDLAKLSGGQMDFIVTYQTEILGLGGGYHLNFSQKIENEQGEIFKFKNRFSPKFVADVRLSKFMNVSLHYISSKFTTTDNLKFNGNRWGFSWNFILSEHAF